MIRQQTETQRGGCKRFHHDDRTKLAEMYLAYPYKTKPTRSKDPYPYVPVKEDAKRMNLSKDKERLIIEYLDWCDIIYSFFDHLTLFLLSGAPYRFSSGMGEFQLNKFKMPNTDPPIDFGKTVKKITEKYDCTWMEARQIWKENKDKINVYRYRNKFSDGWYVSLAWTKREYRFHYYKYWYFKLTGKRYRDIINYFMENQEHIHNIKESRWTYYD